MSSSSRTPHFERTNYGMQTPNHAVRTVATATKPTNSAPDPRQHLVSDVECKMLEKDLFTVTRRKSKHKVRHDVYDIFDEVSRSMLLMAKHDMYPSPEMMIDISRMFQCEHVTESLATWKVQHDYPDVYTTGGKGSAYTVDKRGIKRYLDGKK